MVSKEYYKTHKEQILISNKKWRLLHHEQMKQIHHNNYLKHRESKLKFQNEYDKNIRQRLKLMVVFHYTKGKMQCVCCGEGHLQFLTIDHENNNGSQERKRLKAAGIHSIGSNFYKWLINNNYPVGYQVLCYNCNLGRRKGPCPHNSSTY